MGVWCVGVMGGCGCVWCGRGGIQDDSGGGWGVQAGAGGRLCGGEVVAAEPVRGGAVRRAPALDHRRGLQVPARARGERGGEAADLGHGRYSGGEAGQETFRSIVSAYYNSADAILLCYDLTSYESFESLRDYWLPEAQNNNKTNAKIFLIGNKLDAKREVEAYSLDALRDAGVHAFFEVSAKENINVEKTFLEIARLLHTTNKPPKADKPPAEKQKLSKAPARPKEPAEDIDAPPPKKSCCQ